jgi:sterol desaturase/sphingolipid hydroxylase (fatty acid hydroxylase superfamily)
MNELLQTLMPFIHIAFGPDPDWKQVFLQGLTPLFLLATMIEWRHMRKAQRADVFKGKDVAVNMLLGLGYQTLELVWWGLFISALLNGLYALRIQTLELTPLSFAALMFGLEFCYYWFHRASHRIRWFWCAHVVHHSGENMNTTTAMRQSMFYGVNLHQFFWAPMLVLGYAPWMVMLAYGVNLGYQYFIHTQSVGKLHPWFEFVMNTPSHHRAHHGRNERYIDKNFGGMLIIWDRLFGTFEEEVAEDPVEYGIPKQPATQNLWLLNTHEWADMFKDVMKPGPLGLRLKHLWAPPEWTRPD